MPKMWKTLPFLRRRRARTERHGATAPCCFLSMEKEQEEDGERSGRLNTMTILCENSHFWKKLLPSKKHCDKIRIDGNGLTDT